MKILLIEDDPALAEQIKAYLTGHHYIVDIAPSAEIGWELVELVVYDLIVLDVMLPGMDGLSFCQRLRSHNHQELVLLLTVKGSSHDKVLGLDAGADDYAVKPLEFSELEARMRALLRRQAPLVSAVLQWGQLRLDPISGKVAYGAVPLVLTAKEYGLLALFLRHNQRIYSHGAILNQLWSSEDEPPTEGTVRSHIKRLRQKLSAVGAADLIETVYGLGYRLNQAVTQKPVALEPPPAIAPAPTGQVAEFWRTHHPKLIERIMRLEQQLVTLSQQPHPDPLRQQILQEAHKLAGSLAMLGFPANAELSDFLKTALPQALQTDPIPWDFCQQRLSTLRYQVEHTPAIAPPPPSTPPLPLPRLLFLGPPTPWVDDLTAEVTRQGWQLAIAPDLATAQESRRRLAVDAVLIDLTATVPAPPLLTWLRHLAQQTPAIPAIARIQDRQAVASILALRQAGCQVLLPASPPTQVLDHLTQRLHPTTPEARLWVVDDDRLTLHLLRGLLEPWALQVNTLSDPRECLAKLVADPPDLLMLDIQMPHISGIELCQQVRNHPQLSWLPILVLTAQTDAATIQQVFAAGADDYLSKPIVAPELITRIFNRLERNQRLLHQATRDPITQLPTRSPSQRSIQRLLDQAIPLCFAVLELDHFTPTHRQHGHATGDQLLRHFAHTLQSAWLDEAIISRWTGGEFIVVLPRLTAAAGVTWLAAIASVLQQMPLSLPDGAPLSIRFHAGVTQITGAKNDLQTLYQQAGQALEQAKRLTGGDRIERGGSDRIRIYTRAS